MSFDLHQNHWAVNCFKEVVSTKHLQGILDEYGSWVFRNGQKANIKNKKIGPGRYEVWLENENDKSTVDVSSDL